MGKLTDGKGGSISKESPPEKGQRFVFDDHRNAPRGFGLRITAAGGKAFILKYLSPVTHKDRRMTIGDWPTWSLEAARIEARELRQRIDSGEDPLETKNRRKTEPTLAELVKMYCEGHVSGLKSEAAIIRYFDRDLLPTLGSVKAYDVRRRDLIELIENKAAETPTAARHLLVYVKGLFDWAVDREYIEASPAASIRPKSIAPKGQKNALKQNSRKRVLDHEEIASFWKLVEGSGVHGLTAIALKLVLLTGQRPGEVAGMRLSEIHGDFWVIPQERRLKTETEQRVPLCATASDLIEQAQEEVMRLSKRRKVEPSDYVFETRPGAPMSVGALSKATNHYALALKSRDAQTWGHWRPHDLRRTARTEITACGFPEEIAERVIGHERKGIVSVYNQHNYDAEKRAALEAWERRLLNIVRGKLKDSTNVVPMVRAAQE